jgi:hypothetical protein
MRTEIITSLQAISKVILNDFKITDNLPWEDNGAPLYHHNKKHIYVDMPQTRQEPVLNDFAMKGTVNETNTVRVYFVTDAKQLPSNYYDLVTAVKAIRSTYAVTGVIDRTCQVSTTFQADALITEFEFSNRKTITN